MLTVLSIIVLFTPLSGASLESSGVSLDEVADEALFPPVQFFHWENSSHFIFSTHRGLYQRASVSSPHQTEVWLDATGLSDHDLTINADSQFIVNVESANTENPANRTYFHEIVNRDTNETFKVGPKKTGDEPLQVFEWAPVGSGFAFVFNGQVFISDSPTADAERISEEDGRQHGVFDWVYIFDSPTALWWSPSGSMLAFASTNDRGVRRSTFPLYKQGKAYPTQIEYAYPMTGEKKLPEVTLAIWNKDLKELRQFNVELRDCGYVFGKRKMYRSFHYLFSVSWVRLYGKEQLVAVWANRWQNEIFLTICEFSTSNCVLSFEYKYEHGSIRMWAEPKDFHKMQYSDNELFFKLPQPTPDGDLYQHVARLFVPENYKNATRSTLLSGNYDVAGLLSYDRNTNSVLFLAKAPRPTQLHLFSASAVPSRAGHSPRCLSCFSSDCTYQRAKVSPSGRHALIDCAGPSLKKRLLVDLASSSIDASVVIRLPKDDNTNKTFPLHVDVYAGPGSHKVNEKSETGFNTYLVTKLHYATVSIDGRGSGGRGWKLKSAVYGRLGTVEVADQLETLRLVLDKYSFLDRNRVAIDGWSYGGFASANAVIEDSQKILKCAVSIAPVSNFKYYDATYTERYMGDAPEEAYEASSLIRNVSNFAHTKLLLAHGIADDNVQFVNAALFIEELQKNKIPFEQHVYPNLDHNLSGDIHQARARFLQSCFSS